MVNQYNFHKTGNVKNFYGRDPNKYYGVDYQIQSEDKKDKDKLKNKESQTDAQICEQFLQQENLDKYFNGFRNVQQEISFQQTPRYFVQFIFDGKELAQGYGRSKIAKQIVQQQQLKNLRK